MLTLSQVKSDSLVTFIAKQLDHLFPDDEPDVVEKMRPNLHEAMDRFLFCASKARYWKDVEFSPLHSDMNATFLYFLANTLYRNGAAPQICTKLFYLNKALNGFHCLYDVEMPDVFFIAHSVGIVLGRLKYPPYLVLCQGTTIGISNSHRPTFDEGLIMLPGSSIAGRCHIGAWTILSPNSTLIDKDSPGNCIVSSEGGATTIRAPKRDVFAEYFVDRP
jgi:serine O-acetyltransferase